MPEEKVIPVEKADVQPIEKVADEPKVIVKKKKNTTPKKAAPAAKNQMKELERRNTELESKLEQASKLLETMRSAIEERDAHIARLESRYTAITNHIAQNIDLCRSNILVAIKEGQ